MPRKAAARQTEPASLPDVLVPLSEIPDHQRGAYEIEAINDAEMFRKILSNENFFEMIAGFPQAWWGDRLSMYLYRHEDDGGLMVKNADGEGKYIKPVIRQPVDRDWIANRNGGGKYQLWLNLSTPSAANPDKNISQTVKKYTFRIDGPPMVKEGQVIELGGKPVSVGGVAQPNPAPADTALDKVIDANSRANESSMEIVTSASKAAIAMVQEQAKNAAAPVNPLADVKMLLEILRPQRDPVMDELMKGMIAKALAEPKAPPTVEARETQLTETLDTIKTLTGADSIAELLKPAAKAAAADPVASWGPIVSTVGQVALSFFEKWPHMMAERTRQLQLELQIRQAGGVPPQPGAPAVPGAPARLAAATVVPASEPIPQPTAADPQALVNAVIKFICDGFDRDRNEGSEIAAALDVQFGEQLAPLGIDRMLGDRAEVEKFIAGIPPLTARSKDPRWPEFFEDFMEYTTHTYGPEDDEEEAEPAGPQAVETPKQPVA